MINKPQLSPNATAVLHLDATHIGMQEPAMGEPGRTALIFTSLDATHWLSESQSYLNSSPSQDRQYAKK